MPPKFKNSSAADFVAVKPKPERKKGSKPKTKKPKVMIVAFRFLDLPPEIRAMIYKHLLVESSVELSFTTGGRGKGLSRGHLIKKPASGSRGTGSWVPFKPKREDNKPTILHPDILRVCKFIRVEATPYLYSQTFHFENTIALSRFLARIAPSTLNLLRKIHIRGWAERNMPGSAQALSLSFAMLTAAHNLENIHLDRRVSDSSDWAHLLGLGPLMEEHVKFWIQYVNANGGKKAAEILSFSDINFGSQDEIKNEYKVIEERKKVFFEEVQLD